VSVKICQPFQLPTNPFTDAATFFSIPQTRQPPPFSAHLARTMELLESGGTDTVRVVIYGQSISMQDWWKTVKGYMEKKYPTTPLLVTNRAIGGFSTDRLKGMVENDLVPLSPHLILFHDYGGEEDYEKIIRIIRSRTTAEVAVQTDHVAVGQNEDWHDRHNNQWLPDLCRTYGLALIDVRSAWKEYLQRNQLKPEALLTDNVHLNAHGNYLMAGIINNYLAALSPSVASPLPPTLRVIKRSQLPKVQQQNTSTLTIPIEGTGAVLVWPSKNPYIEKVAVQIDGNKPSALAECYYYTRPTRRADVFFLTNMGQLLGMQLAGNPQAEDWTLTVLSTDTLKGNLRFSLQGSLTGEDGTGSSDSLFRSRSGRIVIAPEGWFRRKSPGDFGQFAWLSPGDKLHWQVKCMCRDEFRPVEETVRLVSGLRNGNHVLNLSGKSLPAPEEVRIYQPPLRK
jgi:hypothetical protein